jgi:hypothetical protein
MSSDRGRSPCATGPLELRLEVIVPGTLAGRCVATRSTELVQRVGEQNVRSDGVVVPVETRLIPVAYAGDVSGSPDDGSDVAHTPAAAAFSDSNFLRCHRSTRASMSTMSHQLAASRGLPQTAPGLAMQAPVASQS